jgi:endonuclease/exonuclease/phosphatase family metal-dependent hydrolase
MERAGAGRPRARARVVTAGFRPTVRVMTWNIHGAHDRNPRFDLNRVIALIERHSPDVVALQEVDSRRPRESGMAEPFAMLQEALGFHGIGAKSIVTQDGEYGQALISRWPMRNAEVHDISYQEREPRRAIRCMIDAPCGALRVIATHLGLSVGERRDQARALLGLIGEAAVTTVAMGDFNDWFWAGSVRKVLAARLPARSRHRTFPSMFPLFRFDRVYCSHASALLSVRTDPEARLLSDHLPVIAEIRPGGIRESLGQRVALAG